MADREVILTIAPIGGLTNKRVTPYPPTQPQEIAEDVYRARGRELASRHSATSTRSSTAFRTMTGEH